MNIWNQAPFVRLLLPFLAGIICAVYLPFQNSYISYITGILICFIILSVLIHKFNFTYKKQWWFGVLLNVTLFLTAYQLALINTENFAGNHYTKYSDSTRYAYIRLTGPYQEKEKSLKVVAEIKAIKYNQEWKNTCGKAMIYFKKDTHSIQLNYGDELIIKSSFNEIPPPQNPGEFNYKRFLAFHNVYQQAYIDNKAWTYTGRNSSNTLLKYSTNLRNTLLNVLKANHVLDDEFAVGSALLLGFEDKLDADIISAYSSTGALHVLSVSGLHVAIVYFIFSWMLFFFDKIKHGNIIKAILLIVLLWLYAALTGLSPSVLRAATMFSFIIMAKAYNRYSNIYNTLSASAFLLLLINPYLIMEVGFQLSYLAVLGIVYIQPKIYKWFEPNNWLLDQIWTITSVSIAAQVATFPLGLLYFHQFPNYFLLSNLVVIPISTAIVYIGTSLFAFAKVSLIAGYLAIAFNWCVWFLNQSVKMIEKWPYALLQGISISIFETWVLYGLIILFLYYFTKRQFRYLLMALTLGVIILCSQMIEQYQQCKQKKLIIYNIPKTSAIDFISAKNNVLLTDSAFAHNESRLLFHIKHNWWDMGVSNTQITSGNTKTHYLNIHNGFIQFYNKRIAVVNEKIIINNKETTPLPIDYLIVSKNLNVRIENLLKLYQPALIVFDSSNSDYRIKKWKAQCCKVNQRFYSVPDSGAFIINLY